MSSERTNIALVQMRCGAEPEKNLARAIEFVRDAARQGAEIVCRRSFFGRNIFVRQRIIKTSIWPRKCREIQPPTWEKSLGKPEQ